MIQSNPPPIPLPRLKCPSLRGRLLRELIAVGVKAGGGDIIALGKKNAPSYVWRPPRGWQREQIILPSGGGAQYLVPKDCSRRDVAVLQLHGGAYTIGFLPIFQKRAAKLARLGGNIPVLSVDYRVAPEYTYPAPLEDAVDALEWLRLKQGIPPESVIAVGESAGAGLSLALAMKLRDSNMGSLRALVLMSPWADLTCRGESYAGRYFMDPMFGRKRPLPPDYMRTAVGELYAGKTSLKDPCISPVFGDFNRLPPMLIHVGEYEMLYDDAAAVYAKACAAGVKAELKVWPGMFHAFQLADALIPEARTAWREIGIFMRNHFAE